MPAELTVASRATIAARPRITVVTPSLNQAEFLEATIRSVLLQGYPNLEYIVMDGGSTDGSVAIIERYEPWIDFWRSESDEGQSDAINRGFGRATGQIVGWLNSDDIYLPGALNTVADLLHGGPFDVLQGATEKVELRGDELVSLGVSSPMDGSRFQDYPIFEDGRRHAFHFIQPSMFWTRDLWQRVGPLDERYHYEMDREWLTRALALGAGVEATAEVLARFTLHPASKSRRYHARFFAERALMYVRLSGQPGFRRLHCLLNALHPLQRYAATRPADAEARGRLLRTQAWRWPSRALKATTRAVPGLQRAVRAPATPAIARSEPRRGGRKAITSENGGSPPVAPSEPARVMYVQLPDGGGSAVSLLALIEGLDRSRYEPVVLAFRPTRYTRRFRELGVRVVYIEPDAATSFTERHRTGKHRDRSGSGGASNGVGRSPRLITRFESAILGRRLRFPRDLKRLVRQDWPLARRVASLIREEAPDLVHQNNSPRGCRATYLGAWLADVPQVGHVRWLHTYSALDRWVARRVDRFIYITEAVRRSCADLGVPSRRERVIYDPVLLADFAGTRGRDEIRAELGIPADAPVVVNVGRLVPWKGQDDFIEALSLVADDLPVHGVIVGSADDRVENRRYSDDLRRLSEGSGLDDRVHFTGFRADVGAIMRSADVVVHSSKRPEPFGRVIVEAMAAERPVIATAAGGVMEAVEDGRTGLLVPMNDPPAMAEAIERLVTDPEGARSIAREGRESAARRFTEAQHAEQVQALYDSLLDRG